MTDGLLVNAGNAARAYRTSQGIPASPVTFTGKSQAPSFMEMVENTARGTVETIRAGDRAAVAGLRGEMPIQEVIEATMAMESSLTLTIAVRDKMVEAYQEIMRMAV